MDFLILTVLPVLISLIDVFIEKKRYIGNSGSENSDSDRQKELIKRIFRMTKILFVCHGNICRSPMAEFILKDLADRAGVANRFEIASAATSDEELGNPVYPPVHRLLSQRGIDCSGKTARRLRKDDYQKFDLLIGMDQENLRNMGRVFGGDSENKIHLLRDYTDQPGDVADPWYTGDYETTWRVIESGCQQLLKLLLKQE